jgi:hypothetical protein
MTDNNDPRRSNLPDVLREPLSRRSFLHGVGALSLAAMVPQALLGLDAEATLEAALPERPLLGALFNPYHRPEDWSLLARRRPEGMPQLGAYAGYAVGSVATQIIWARMAGVRFFLAAYSPSRPVQREGLDALFEVAARDGYPVGLYIDLQDHAGRPPQHPPQVRLAAALEQVASRYVPHPSYLRTSGRPVLAVAGLNDGSLLDAALEAAGGAKAWGPVLRFPAAWRSTPDAQAEPELARAVSDQGLYVGFSARSGARGFRRAVPCHGRPASAVLVSPARGKAGTLELPPVAASAGGPAYVILDSFNNWGVSVPLEPGTVSRTAYVTDVARWARAHAA